MRQRPETPPDDEQTLILVQRAQSDETGDAGWSNLAAKIRLRIQQRLRREALPAHESLEDYEQLVFLEVVRQLPGFVIEGRAQFWAWIEKIIAHSFEDRRRRNTAQKRGAGRSAVELEGDLSRLECQDAMTQSAVARAHELEAQFRAAVATLRPEWRRILELRILQEKSFKEICAEMGYDREVSARALFFRAKQGLDAELRYPSDA